MLNNTTHDKTTRWFPIDGTYAGFATVKDTAAFLRVSEKTVRRLIARGIFRPSKAVRKILIPRSQLEAFEQATA